MKPISGVLDVETQLLISVGSAVAAGCIPCLQTIVAQARAHGIAETKLKAAARTGQFIKEQPQNHMKAFADELLGTHLQGAPASAAACPAADGGNRERSPRQDTAAAGCACAPG